MTGNYIKILIVCLSLIWCSISWDSFDQKSMQSLGFMKQMSTVNELLLLQDF